MEALVAVGMACLTIVDMGKAIDRGMVVEGIRVLEKHGGRSGSHVADGRRPSAS
jgi:cyclic pyranopterin phosphate synthase